MLPYCASVSLPPHWEKLKILPQWCQAAKDTAARRLSDPLWNLVHQVLSQELIVKETISPLTDRIKKKEEWLLTDDQKANQIFGPVSLFHLAAIAGNVELGELLYKADCVHEEPIKSGATPFHLAALRGEAAFLERAERWGIDIKIKTVAGFTAVDLFEVIYPNRAYRLGPLSTRPNTISIWRNGSFEKVSMGEIERVNEFCYTERVCAQASQIEKIVFNTFIMKEIYHRPIPHPPLLGLAKITEIFAGLKVDPGMGVIALEDIPDKTFLGEYSGIATPHPVAGEYVLGLPDGLHIDGQSFRNFVPMLADGPPNVKILGIKLHAITKIKKGELICWDYGPYHKIKVEGPYAKLAPERLKYILDNFQGLLRKCRSKASPTDFEIHSVSYILGCRYLLLKYILQGKIKPEWLSNDLHHTVTENLSEFWMVWFSYSTELLNRIKSEEQRSILWKHLKEIGKENYLHAFRYYFELLNALPIELSGYGPEKWKNYLHQLQPQGKLFLPGIERLADRSIQSIRRNRLAKKFKFHQSY